MILDAHVHLRDWSQSYKETVEHAFGLCARLGIRGLIEMPNTSPPLTRRQAIVERLELAERAAQNLLERGLYAPYYAMHIGLERSKKQVSKAVAMQREFFPRTAGLKMYAGHSTGDMGIVEGSAQHVVYSSLAAENYSGVLVVHCEAEELVDNSLFCAAEPTSHSRARPVEAELRSIEQQLQLAEAVGFQGHLHIAHISTPEGVALIQQARKIRSLSCGVTPHHTMFSLEEQAKWQQEELFDGHLFKDNLSKGNLFKVNPPLREEWRRKALWELLLSGQIDWIESDHAPHAVHEKLGAKSGTVASGIPGLSGLNLLYWKLERAGMSHEQLAALSYRNALNMYQLPWQEEDFASGPPRAPELCEQDFYGGVDPYYLQGQL